MSTITLVTGNAHKLAEFQEILKDFEFINKALDVPEIQAATIEEVAHAKAAAAFDIVGSPVIVEDCSFGLAHLNGLPGPFIKYFEEVFPKEAGLRLLGDAPNRTAVARACIAYRDASMAFEVVGEVRGTVSDHVHDGTGFGFDFYFIPDGHTQTYSEMGLEKKSTLSHRHAAVYAFKKGYAVRVKGV